jgi:DNA-binding HxlR family transcriptional regulator
MSENTRTPLTTKVHLYHALYLVNRGFDITLAGLKRLEELGIFRHEDLSEYEVSVELARCEANGELTSVLQRYEEEDSVFWGDRLRERQKQRSDPDDVFFAATERKQEIKEQIKQLQAGLARQSPRKPRAKKRRVSGKKQRT